MALRHIASHPRRALLLAACVVAVAGMVGGPLPGKLSSSGGFVARGADSQTAVQRLKAATGDDVGPGIVLLLKTSAPSRVRAVAARLGDLPGIARVATRPSDGRAFVVGTLRAGADDDDAAEAALDAFGDEDDVVVGGPAVAGYQTASKVTADLGRAELIAFPILLLLSLLFFRGRATLMPLVVGVTTVLGTFLVLTGVNELYALNVFAINLVIGLGLGLAIDYTLFLVTRFREELDAGADVTEAVATTMATAGRSVVFSAATVASALITLTLFPQGFLKSMAIAGATVAIVAAVAALVLSPALFGLWGAKLARRHRAADGDGASWRRLARWVMRARSRSRRSRRRRCWRSPCRRWGRPGRPSTHR